MKKGKRRRCRCNGDGVEVHAISLTCLMKCLRESESVFDFEDEENDGVYVFSDEGRKKRDAAEEGGEICVMLLSCSEFRREAVFFCLFKIS